MLRAAAMAGASTMANEKRDLTKGQGPGLVIFLGKGAHLTRLAPRDDRPAGHGDVMALRWAERGIM